MPGCAGAATRSRRAGVLLPAQVAIYTRTSSKKSEVRLSTSKKRQVDTCLAALKGSDLKPADLKRVQKVSETLSGRLPLAERPAFRKLIDGSAGKLKIFVESARAVARDAGAQACSE